MFTLLGLLPPRLFLVTTSLAQVFDGPGLEAGAGTAGEIEGPAKMTLRNVILTLLYQVLNFLALAAVVVIIIAGLILIFSFGEDSKKDTAKKTIIYTIIGLLVILLARAVVSFLLYGLFFGQ